jgi:hypothetical protein
VVGETVRRAKKLRQRKQSRRNIRTDLVMNFWAMDLKADIFELGFWAVIVQLDRLI